MHTQLFSKNLSCHWQYITGQASSLVCPGGKVVVDVPLYGNEGCKILTLHGPIKLGIAFLSTRQKGTTLCKSDDRIVNAQWHAARFATENTLKRHIDHLSQQGYEYVSVIQLIWAPGMAQSFGQASRRLHSHSTDI